MSHYKFVTLSLAALVVAGTIGAVSPASASAGGKNIIGPDVIDTTTVRSKTSANTDTCYIEPAGFHTNIRWDGACRDAQKAQRSQEARSTAAERPYEEPTGFHYNLRMTAK